MRVNPLSGGRNQQVYYKLVTFVLLLSFLPLVTVSIVFYHNAKTAMQQELLKANAQYLKQSANAVETVINQISHSFSQLTMEGTTMQQFEQFPRGLYYEALSGELKDEDLPSLQSYLREKKQVFQNLRTLKLSGEFIHSVYYYDNAKGIILTSDMLQYTPDQFYDQEWDRYPKKDVSFPVILDIRNSSQPNGRTKKVIPLIYKTSIDGNFLSINLDADALYRSFLSKKGKTDNPFFVLSSNGRLMLHDQTNDGMEGISLNQVSHKPLGAGEEAYIEEELEGKRLLVTYLKSDLLGWTFGMAAPVDQLYKSVANLKGLIMLISFLLAVATGLLAFFTARNLYAPLFRLLQFIKHKDNGYRPMERNGGSSGEWQLIRNSLEQAYEDRESLAARLKESLPAYKEAFVRSLLRKNAYTPDYIRERIEYLGIGLPSGSLLLMAVSVEETGKGQDMIEESINKLRIGDRIGQSLPADRPHIVSEVAEGLYVAIANGGASDTAAWFASAEKVIRQLQTGLSRKASIGIGRPCPAIEHIHRAYDEAAEALRYRRLAGGREVIYIEDVSLEGTPLLAYPKEKEESLTSYIINGETEQARRVFAAMTQEIGAQGSKLHYHQIQQAYTQVLGSLVAAAHHMKLDLNQVTGEKNNLYSVLLDQNDRQATIAWLDGIIVRLCAEIGNAFRNKNNRHVDQAVRMVTEELARPVTLAAVAERLKLNPSYLSRIFKEQKGESFSDFVTRIRMDKGKQLLLETDLKIKEIGEQVGYQKTDYFIRLFKEFTGMTPGEYRQNRSLPQS